MRLKLVFSIASICLLVVSYSAVQTSTPQPPTPPESLLAPVSFSSGVFYVGAQTLDKSVWPNLGVRASIQVISTTVEGSGCLAFWVSDSELTNNMWGQVGYYECTGSSPTAFFEVWNIATGTDLCPTTTSCGLSPVLATGTHVFSMAATSSTTWTFMVDGTTLGTWNMGGTSLMSTYPIYSTAELQGATAFTYPQVTFPIAIQGFVNGVWVSADKASSYNAPGLGIQGNAQKPSISVDSIVLGDSTAVTGSGATLWTGTLYVGNVASPYKTVG